MISNNVPRRAALLLVAASGAKLSAPAHANPQRSILAERLTTQASKGLSPLTAFGVASKSGDVRYPSWLLGDWAVKNSAKSYSMPLGDTYVDSYEKDTCKQDVEAGTTLSYKFRFVKATPSNNEPSLNVAQDRRFNAIQESNAFSGGVVDKCSYESNRTYAPHGRLLFEETDPDGATFRTDIGIEWAQWNIDTSTGGFVTDELLRQTVTFEEGEIFKKRTTDLGFFEIVTLFQPDRSLNEDGRPEVVIVQNRVVRYLSLPGSNGFSYGSPPAASGVVARDLANRAAGRAVSVFDYEWKMIPIPSSKPRVDERRRERKVLLA